MMIHAKKSKRLVIDASIARASGGKTAVDSNSKACRDVLQTVLDICHHIVLTPSISEEWNRHQSKFARRWLVQMYGKKKVSMIIVKEDEKLRSKLTRNLPEDVIQIILKDCILIEAGLASDKIILSSDNRVRKHFSKACENIPAVKTILWANPNEKDILIWLQGGAELEEARQLQFFKHL